MLDIKFLYGCSRPTIVVLYQVSIFPFMSPFLQKSRLLCAIFLLFSSLSFLPPSLRRCVPIIEDNTTLLADIMCEWMDIFIQMLEAFINPISRHIMLFRMKVAERFSCLCWI